MSDQDTHNPVDYSKFDGKKVVLHVKDPNDPEGVLELHGKVVAGTPVGMMFQPKGRSTPDLYTGAEIESCEVEVEDVTVKVKYIKEVVLGGNKQHLADRHGFLLPVVNEMTEEEAASVHEQQHSNHENLGHAHGEKPRTVREDAIQAADANADESVPLAEGEVVEVDGEDNEEVSF